jgi:hypothetical protein
MVYVISCFQPRLRFLHVTGSSDDLAAFHEGFLLYLRGAVRCPSFPPLLERFEQELSP